MSIFRTKNRQQTLKKAKKQSKYAKDSVLLKLLELVEQSIDDEEKIPTRVGYVEKKRN